MQTSRRVIAVLVLFAVSIGVASAGKGRPVGTSCPADLVTAFGEACPCDAARTHGRHVSCVVRYGEQLRKAGCPRGALQSVMRCARQSTCGRAIAVRCCILTSSPCGDPTPGDGVAAGACGADAGRTCDTDDDCVVTHARMARDAASCAAAGGVSAGTGSVCEACGGVLRTTTSTTLATLAPSTSTTSSTSASTTSTSTTSTTLPAGTNYGNSAEFPAASAHAPDYLLGVPVVVPQAAMLTHLCVIAKMGGPHVVLALYASDRTGMPSQLVAFTAPTSISAGVMELPVPHTAIAAGTYWIAGVYDADASIGIDETHSDAPVVYAAVDFGRPLPETFDFPTQYWGQRFNYYVKVE